jgi:hypothetical protein
MTLPIPILKLELEHMRQAIRSAVLAHHEDIQKALDQETAKLIESFDFGAEVRKHLVPIMEEVVKETLSHHFRYGEGRKAIEEMILAGLKVEVKDG